MRMTPNHFVSDAVCDVSDVEGAFLGGHLAMEDDLKEQVSQLFLQVGHVAPLYRIGDFVGLLDRIGRNRGEVLFGIPRAAGVRMAQSRHDFNQLDKGLRGGIILSGFRHGLS